LEETPALEELISLLRLERVVSRDAAELRGIVKRVGLEWAIDFGCAGAAAVSDADLADLNDFDSAVASSVGDPELAKLLKLEVAVSSAQPLKALSQTASFRTGDWQSVIDVLFRFTHARPTRWRGMSHALKEILQRFPESAKSLEGQGKLSVGEQLLWLSIDGCDRESVAGSLDPTQPNFVVAWREFHGRRNSPLLTPLVTDDVGSLRSQLLATGELSVHQFLEVVAVGGDMLEASKSEGRTLSLLAVAAQFGAVRCAQFLLTNGAMVRAAEVEAAFRGGNGKVIRLLWGVFPNANPFEVAVEATKPP
jgi:hypothetical protein